MTERDSLTCLFEHCGGKRWRAKINWMSNERSSLWHGIEVDSHGYVSEINLRDNKLTGQIPNSTLLKHLKNLKSLCLSSNLLSGQIPASLSHFNALQALDLSWNALTGESWRLVPWRLIDLFF